jgi:hypothetical protein
LSSAAIPAATRVSFRAATASALETASQKPRPPSAVEAQARAAIGRTTTIERKAVTKPRERAPEARSLAP